MRKLGTYPLRLLRAAWRGVRVTVRALWRLAGLLVLDVAPWLGSFFLDVAPLGLIAYGCWLVYPPAGYFVPGLLWWIDNYVPSRRRVGLVPKE